MHGLPEDLLIVLTRQYVVDESGVLQEVLGQGHGTVRSYDLVGNQLEAKCDQTVPIGNYIVNNNTEPTIIVIIRVHWVPLESQAACSVVSTHAPVRPAHVEHQGPALQPKVDEDGP